MKTHLLALATALLSLPAFAAYEVGDNVQNVCWNDVDNKQVCLDDTQEVRVLIYNAGWCGPCNREMASLAPRSAEYVGKPVRFISLSAQGWGHGSAPDQKFLGEWRDKHTIPFTVAASPNDAGDLFGQEYIPNVAIVGRDGKLTYKEVAPEVDELFTHINEALK